MIFYLGLGNPHHPNNITVLYGCGFGFKKLGLGQTPPRNLNFGRKLVLGAPLTVFYMKSYFLIILEQLGFLLIIAVVMHPNGPKCLRKE